VDQCKPLPLLLDLCRDRTINQLIFSRVSTLDGGGSDEYREGSRARARVRYDIHGGNLPQEEAA